MSPEEVIALYRKEREYETEVFGDYKKVESLSFPSFLILLDEYVQKAKKAYAGKWDSQLPRWMVMCDEYIKDMAAPVEAYEQVIKIMALAGAALETYSTVRLDEWRKNPEEDKKKWQDDGLVCATKGDSDNE